MSRLLLFIYSCINLNHFSFAAEDTFTIETGRLVIALSNGWERLDQPVNFFVQKRARHAEQGIALSAGSFRLDLTLEQYTALGLAGMASGLIPAIEKLAKDVGIPKGEIEQALASKIGRQLTGSLKQASQSMKFELLKLTKRQVCGKAQFEICSKAFVRQSGQTFFSRQFLLSGSTPREIVQITYASTSEDIFTIKELVEAIHPQLNAK
ncbi:MAG: hypothetical protein JNK85_01730 [Verrucomicrobiales bacterium]|nr:hypothetical protein [Verrucomicrobiales bacterium]